MARQGLNERALEHIKDNGIVYGKIAETLNISPISLPRLLYANDPKLTQADVLRILRESIGVKKDSELLEEINETAKKEVA